MACCAKFREAEEEGDVRWYGGGTYRINNGIVERLDHDAWHESVYLTISAPKGRRG